MRADKKRQLHSFVEGDLLYAHLRKEKFLRGTYNKLKLKKIGPCRILKNILDNGYVLEFPKRTHISSTFNVSNLSKFEEGSTSDGKEIVDLMRQMPVQLREEVTKVLDE